MTSIVGMRFPRFERIGTIQHANKEKKKRIFINQRTWLASINLMSDKIMHHTCFPSKRCIIFYWSS